MVALLILALITSPAGSGISRVLLVMGLSEQQSDATLTEFTIEAPQEVGEDLEAAETPTIELDVNDIFEMAEPISDAIIAPVELGVTQNAIDIQAPMFNGRSGAMKKALLSIYGGTPQTEEAVSLGLQWLKRNQQRNGSWSMRGPFDDGGITENRTAATAMAMLAFLGDGNTHLGGEYQDQVEKGMKFLIGQQGRDGFMASDARGHEKMYAQAQASIVLCELYAMTQDSWLRPRAQLAVDFAQKSQSPEGGWRYEPRFDSDTSVTGWFVMALKSAQSAKLEVNESYLRKVGDYLDTVSHFDGAGYSYQQQGRPSPAMTAEGLLCRQYLGWQREHPPMRNGIEALLLDAPFDLRDRDVYYWYYATQVLHHYGGSPWRQWNDVMRVQLPEAQVKSGRESGSWAPQGDQWGRNSGRLYTTCLSIFCLEVYYRHMPLYKEGEKANVGEGTPIKEF
ncbi:MAG: terpene cyclase/mutase family protein [Pirellulaceae bacterium]|nr:terpene cyclase/mutase family protein [Pirellulaceae bacterium]